jgi:hypothetical protein
MAGTDRIVFTGAKDGTIGMWQLPFKTPDEPYPDFTQHCVGIWDNCHESQPIWDL